MRLTFLAPALIGLLVAFVFKSSADGQDAPNSSTENHTSAIEKRDALAKQALAKANLGEFEEARKLFDQVFKIEQSVFGEAHEQLLGTLDYQARAADAAKDWDAATGYRRRAYEMGQRLYPQGNYQLRDLELALEEARKNARRTDQQRRLLSQLSAAYRQAVTLRRQGKHGEALAPAKFIVKVREKVLGKEHHDYASSLNNVAGLHMAMGDYLRAEPLYVEAKQIHKKVLGKEHPVYATTVSNLAGLYKSMGDYARAEPLYVEAKGIYAQVLGEKHPSFASILNNLAGLYEAKGDYARAEPLFIEAKTIREEVFGKEHPDYAISLNNLAALYKEMGEFVRAEPLYVEAKAIIEQAVGKKHPSYAATVNNLAGLYKSMGDYAQAEPLYVECKAIIEQVLGKKHPTYAITIDNLAVLYQTMGNHSQAEPLYVEAKEIRKEVLGEEHPQYAITLNNLASLYRAMGDYVRAEPLYVEAKEIRKKVLGKAHPEYAITINNLAGLYQATGDYARAESLYLEAKAIDEEALGKEHPSYASSLNNLAQLYQSMGDYARAEPLYVEAKAINEQGLGKEHPSYAASVNNLAGLYESMGDYARAEPLYVEAKEIRKKERGKEHPSYATSLNNLAGLYESMADYARAEPLYVEAIAIWEKVLGKEHPSYATSLNNLAGLYKVMGDYARAEPLYVEAKKIREKVLGKEHPDYASSLNNLAALYLSMGDAARAKPLFIEANAIDQKTLGTEHPKYADSLNNLAVLYQSMEDYARAEPLFVEAKKIRENLLGKEHPDYASSLNNLAGLYLSMGNHGRAEPLYREAVDITLKHLNRTAFAQSEQQQMLMSQSLRFRLDNYLSCCIDGNLNADGAVGQLILWKGSILRRGRDLRATASDPVMAEKLQELQSLASRHSVAIHKIPSPDRIEDWKKQLSSLTEKKRQLEVDLSRSSADFRDPVEKISFADIRQSIPADGVLIDYLEYESNRGRLLVASVIRRDGDLTLLNLGSAERAGKAIDTWRKRFGMTDESRAAGAELRQQLWEPLLKHVSNAELILVSTDGVLGRLPFAALPGKQPHTYLLEDHRLVLIPVPQLLPALVDTRGTELPKDMLLVGDVDYGEPEKAWTRLSETGMETDFIKTLVARTIRMDAHAVMDLRAESATESAFRNLAPKAQLLHLATHGFFAPADKKNAFSPIVTANAYRSVSSPLDMSQTDREMVFGFSPGQLSGLVFAGANLASRTINKFSDGELRDDGIMTADEIAYLPLENTKLAVLSACETGLGEVAGGEGLIGIQRAFQIAGADSVVATMWKVDDVMTRKLMERFYQNQFVEKMSKLDALREAQLWVLRNPSLVEQSGNRGDVRKRRHLVEATVSDSGPRTNPFYWAPFVLSGDWR